MLEKNKSSCKWGEGREEEEEEKKVKGLFAKWKSEIREIPSSSTDYIFSEKARAETKFIY